MITIIVTQFYTHNRKFKNKEIIGEEIIEMIETMVIEKEN